MSRFFLLILKLGQTPLRIAPILFRIDYRDTVSVMSGAEASGYSAEVLL
jgi:hypothetical protein